jgi:GTP-binding protein
MNDIIIANFFDFNTPCPAEIPFCNQMRIKYQEDLSKLRDYVLFVFYQLLPSRNDIAFAKFHYISALKSTGIMQMLKSIDAAYAAAMAKLPTPQLTRALQEALDHQQPRRKGSIRPKLRYAHQGGQNPPIIVIHGNALESIESSYKRYLEKHFRDSFSLTGTPLRIEFRSGKNPFSRQE